MPTERLIVRVFTHGWAGPLAPVALQHWNLLKSLPAPPPLCLSPLKGERTLALMVRCERPFPLEGRRTAWGWGGKAMPSAVSAAACAGMVLFTLGLMFARPASAQQSQCWQPQQLAASPDERLIHKLDGTPETRPVKRQLIDFSPVPESLAGSIRRVKLRGGRKLVAFTFDLCEANGQITGYDGAIVDTLRENHVKATFFAGGKWLLDHGERAEQLMADPLFEIGNHSWSHPNLRLVDTSRSLREIRNGQAAYEQMREQLAGKQCLIQQPAALAKIPARLELFRFPYGACNAVTLQEVAAQGLLAIQWDVAMADPVLMQTGDRIVKTVLAKVRPGSIIIGHANGRGAHTNDALPVLIQELRKRGYEFVTVSQLLAAGEPEITQDCYDEKPNDLDRYDTPKEQMLADKPHVVKAPDTPPQDQPKPVSQKVRAAKADKQASDPLWPAFLKFK